MLAMIGLLPAVVFAEGYGDVRGRFVLDGPALSLSQLVDVGGKGAKDADICGVSGVPDESIVVDENGNVANVVLFPLEKPKAIHPELVAPPKTPVVFDTKGCRFVPHILSVRVGQPIIQTSHDTCAHNTSAWFVNNYGWSFAVPPNDRKGTTITLNKAEPLPIPVRCDIHPYMQSYWLINDHPYTAVSAADGTFAIEQLPEGVHTFRIWQETAGYLDRDFEIEIKAGQVLDLGDMKLKMVDSEDSPGEQELEMVPSGDRAGG